MTKKKEFEAVAYIPVGFGASEDGAGVQMQWAAVTLTSDNRVALLLAIRQLKMVPDYETTYEP